MAGVGENLGLLAEAPGGVQRLRELFTRLAFHGALTSSRPTEWKTLPLGDVVRFQNGYAFKSEWFSSNGIRLARNANVAHGALDWRDSVFLPDGRAKEFSAFALSAGDTLLSLDRPIISTGLKVAVVTNGDLPCLLLQRVAKLTPTPELLTADFLLHWLRSPLFVDVIDPGRSNGVPHISTKQVASLPISLPSVFEQHRIVAKVDELMALCDRLEARQQDAEAAHARLVQALLDSLTQARDAEEFQACWQRVASQLDGIFTTEASVDRLEDAVLELAIAGRLTRAGSMGNVLSDLSAIREERARNLTPARLKKHEADAAGVYWACPYKLPERWQWVSLAAVVLQITDGTHHTPTYVDEGTPFISVKDLDGRTVSFDECRHIPHEEHVAINERCNPERGDILICRIGTLGRPTIVDTDRAFSIFVSVGLLKMPKSIELAEYIHFVLRTPLAYRQYDRIKAGGSHTNKLNLGDIPKIMVALPPAEERSAMLAVMQEVLGLCGLLRSRIAAARSKHAQLAEALVAQAVAA
jgi:type I restriction enzyme S subunit